MAEVGGLYSIYSCSVVRLSKDLVGEYVGIAQVTVISSICSCSVTGRRSRVTTEYALNDSSDTSIFNMFTFIHAYMFMFGHEFMYSI